MSFFLRVRYYFIVRLKPEDNPNFEQIRRRSVAAVWILLVLHTFLCFSIGLASMRYKKSCSTNSAVVKKANIIQAPWLP